MHVQPYLFFNGRCEEAIAFYQQALGAHVDMVMRFSESPDPTPPDMTPPDWGHKVMHSSFRIGDTSVMASDGCGAAPQPGAQGFSLSISVADAAAADKAFAALADGGQVQMPLGTTFWSPRFGMLTDRFGIGWMVGVDAPNAN